ncbi:MAG: SurA N-terminal domain-containing protein [Sphingomonas sp.]
MLSFLRRLTNSKVGIIVTFVALIVIALAFAAGDITRYGSGGQMQQTTVAKVGDTTISADELKADVQTSYNIVRQQNPQVTMAEFVQGGGFDAAVTRMINLIALKKFAEQQDMKVSKRAVDGEIASAPALQGPDGKFDPALYKQLLATQRVTDAQLRGQIVQQLYAQMLTSPTSGATQVPEKLAQPYASLLLEARSGQIGFVPTKVMPTGGKPDDKQLQTYYQRHIGQYTLPERRVIDYTIVSPDAVKAQATPTDAEIAQAYKAQAARFQATEKRDLSQVIVSDQKTAQAIADKVKGGTSLDAAAKAAGLEASAISGVTKDDYTKQSSADLANAVFAAKQGALVGPVKAPLGWALVRVEKVTQVAGQTLAQAHDTLAKEIAAEKANQLLGKLHDTIDDAVTGGGSFKDVVTDHQLQAKQTPPVDQQGLNPEDPASKPDPELAQVVQSGFGAQPGDSPELVPVGQDGSFAVVSLAKVIPSAPQPLAKVHDQVMRDYVIDQQEQQARKIASTIVAAVNGGKSMRDAFAAAKLPLPPVQPVHATRAQIMASQQGTPPALAAMFSTPANHAKLLPAPNNAGFLVVYTETVTPGDASGKPDVVKATRQSLGQFVGNEYAQEFASAVRQQVGVTRNEAAIAKLKQELAGDASGADDAQP